MSYRTRTTASALTLITAILLVGVAGCSGGTDGASLVESKCSTCHSVDFVTNANYTTEEEWTSLVSRMETKGLEVDDAQRTMIIDHLVSQSAQ